MLKTIFKTQYFKKKKEKKGFIHDVKKGEIFPSKPVWFGELFTLMNKTRFSFVFRLTLSKTEIWLITCDI